MGTLVILGLIGCESVPESPLAARARSVFGLSLPCSVASCAPHLDGGSLGGVLIGARGDSLEFAWDGAMRVMPEPPASILHDRARLSAWGDSVASAGTRLAYIGADWFGAPGASPLAVGSPAETLFIEILRSCAGRDSSSSFHPLLARRNCPPPSYFAWRIIQCLEEQRAHSFDKSARRVN